MDTSITSLRMVASAGRNRKARHVFILFARLPLDTDSQVCHYAASVKPRGLP